VSVLREPLTTPYITQLISTKYVYIFITKLAYIKNVYVHALTNNHVKNVMAQPRPGSKRVKRKAKELAHAQLRKRHTTCGARGGLE
jgi:hypothetical protein